MFTIRSFLALALISVNVVAHNNNEKILHIADKEQLKDFVFGFGLGVVHGGLNNIAMHTMKSVHEQNAFEVATFFGSHQLESEYIKNKYVNDTSKCDLKCAHTFGHGIGQIVGEAIDISNPTQPKLQMNVTLLIAAIFPWFKHFIKD